MVSFKQNDIFIQGVGIWKLLLMSKGWKDVISSEGMTVESDSVLEVSTCIVCHSDDEKPVLREAPWVHDNHDGNTYPLM